MKGVDSASLKEESFPVEVIFRNLERSQSIEEEAQRRAQKLYQLNHHIRNCRVTIELDGKHHQQGKKYDVRVDVMMPGKELVISHDQSNEDAYVALRDALDSAKRMLEDHTQKQRP